MLDNPTKILRGQNNNNQMTTLSKINYLFSIIPIQPMSTWFKSLDLIISSFYWKNKPLRIRLAIIKKPKSQGGLKLLHFFHHFPAN